MEMPRLKRILGVVGGVSIGWGGARLMPLLAEHWSFLHASRAAFQESVPIWLWGITLLLLGIAILVWASRQRRSEPLLNNSVPSSSEEEVAVRMPTNTPAPQPRVESEAANLPASHFSRPHRDGDSPATRSSSTNSQRASSLLDAPQQGARDESAPPAGATGGQNRKQLKIVAIGGGTGMPQLLRGLRSYSDHITAIVTVADDGGSSGRLRAMGILPPGDFRNNIAALSESEDLITRLFQYRFPRGDSFSAQDDKTGLAGHNFGNIFIATMAAVTGSFESGLAESSRVLAVRGRVLPSTLEQVTLCAEILRTTHDEDALSSSDDPRQSREEWLLVEGESRIPEVRGTILRAFLKPQQVRAYPEAIRAILQADLIVAGPGSFFTSIMPNLLVPAVRDAILASTAPRIYLCNIITQPGETDHYDVSNHMLQLHRHTGQTFTTVLANHNYDLKTMPGKNSQWVTLPKEDRSSGYISDMVDGSAVEYRLFTGDLVSQKNRSKHDPQKLAARLFEVYQTLRSNVQ